MKNCTEVERESLFGTQKLVYVVEMFNNRQRQPFNFHCYRNNHNSYATTTH